MIRGQEPIIYEKVPRNSKNRITSIFNQNRYYQFENDDEFQQVDGVAYESEP
jgi:hypothetical protein